MNFEHQKTNEILHWFQQLSEIPRCSKNEAALACWLLAWAADHGFSGIQDKTGNVLIRVPGSVGYEHLAPVVLQGHMDMVCEKTPESTHDFARDGIRLVYDGEWLRADQTTLGADNGIAIAMGLTAALDRALPHPPLELLFTVDEETGLTGAFGLEPGFFTGKRLLNIDSEKEGVFTVGCAGGMRSVHRIPLQWESLTDDFVPLTLVVGGLAGGHSADIHQEKANGLKVLTRTLVALQQIKEFRLAFLEGGSADNAIPRNATAVLVMRPEEGLFEVVQNIVHKMQDLLSGESKNSDPQLFIQVRQGCVDYYPEVMTLGCTARLLLFLQAMPHGIYAMSTDIPNFVETSNNFASMKVENGVFYATTSQRSPADSRLDDISAHIQALVCLAGGSTTHHNRYPGWPANKNSLLLKQSVEVYESLFGVKPIVETTHGGLECGVIGNKFPYMDMISFGPTIEDPHSPEERIHLGSIGRIWDFLAALLKSLRD